MFEDWGELKSFRTGGVKTLELGAYRFGGGGGVFVGGFSTLLHTMEKGILKTFTKFTGKHLCLNV